MSPGYISLSRWLFLQDLGLWSACHPGQFQSHMPPCTVPDSVWLAMSLAQSTSALSIEDPTDRVTNGDSESGTQTAHASFRTSVGIRSKILRFSMAYQEIVRDSTGESSDEVWREVYKEVHHDDRRVFREFALNDYLEASDELHDLEHPTRPNSWSWGPFWKERHRSSAVTVGPSSLGPPIVGTGSVHSPRSHPVDTVGFSN
jgi:hypothetical protein